jgi:hypothetical protein
MVHVQLGWGIAVTERTKGVDRCDRQSGEKKRKKKERNGENNSLGHQMRVHKMMMGLTHPGTGLSIRSRMIGS